MCGIVGFAGLLSEENHGRFSRLFDQSTIRGMHAYGTAYFAEDCDLAAHHTFKAESISKSLGQLIGQNCKIIAHARYSTSGNYSSHLNNQPLIRGNTALAFNGVVTQKPKYEWARAFGVECFSENDGEILLAMKESGFGIPEAIEKLKATFAGIWIENGSLYAFRNLKRPLYRFVKENAVFYASTKDIFARATVSNEPEQLIQGKVYVNN